jgi:hypothetical protein
LPSSFATADLKRLNRTSRCRRRFGVDLLFIADNARPSTVCQLLAIWHLRIDQQRPLLDHVRRDGKVVLVQAEEISLAVLDLRDVVANKGEVTLIILVPASGVRVKSVGLAVDGQQLALRSV